MFTGHGAGTGSRARTRTRAAGHAPQAPPWPERSEAPRPSEPAESKGLAPGGVEGPGQARVVVVVVVMVQSLCCFLVLLWVV